MARQEARREPPPEDGGTRIARNSELPAAKAKVAALFTGFITDPDGTAGGVSGTNTGGAPTLGMAPGTVTFL